MWIDVTNETVQSEYLGPGWSITTRISPEGGIDTVFLNSHLGVLRYVDSPPPTSQLTYRARGGTLRTLLESSVLLFGSLTETHEICWKGAVKYLDPSE